MKNVSLIFSAILMTAIVVNSYGGGTSNEAASSNTTSTHNEVTIGKQVWMTENLNVDKFRNGDPILHAKTKEEWEKADINKQPAWCYYDNEPSNGGMYGRLYNWFAVNDPRGLAPIGYHIPSDAEWTVLIDYLGGYAVAGKKMKSLNGWIGNGKGTNESGFSGLPGGGRYDNGAFEFIAANGRWWSSTEFNADFAGDCKLSFDSDNADMWFIDKGRGLSVRCLKD